MSIDIFAPRAAREFEAAAERIAEDVMVSGRHFPSSRRSAVRYNHE